jgi:hypothetical protein
VARVEENDNRELEIYLQYETNFKKVKLISHSRSLKFSRKL